MNLSEFRLFRAVDVLEGGTAPSRFVPGEDGVTSIEQANGVVLIRRATRDLLFSLSLGYAFIDKEPQAVTAKVGKK